VLRILHSAFSGFSQRAKTLLPSHDAACSLSASVIICFYVFLLSDCQDIASCENVVIFNFRSILCAICTSILSVKKNVLYSLTKTREFQLHIHFSDL